MRDPKNPRSKLALHMTGLMLIGRIEAHGRDIWKVARMNALTAVSEIVSDSPRSSAVLIPGRSAPGPGVRPSTIQRKTSGSLHFSRGAPGQATWRTI